MRTIAIDVSAVCLSVTRLRCANTAERIEVLFGVETLGTQGSWQGSNFPHGFDAAFAKLLWLYLSVLVLDHKCIAQSSLERPVLNDARIKRKIKELQFSFKPKFKQLEF